MSISGTRAGVNTVNTGAKRICGRCGQIFRRKNQDFCDDCTWLDEPLPEDVISVMKNYEEGLSDAASAAAIKRSVSFVRRTRTRYGLLSTRAQQDNPDGVPIDYTDPTTGAARFNWVTDNPRGWYYRYTFVGSPLRNALTLRDIMARINDEKISTLSRSVDRGTSPEAPAIVLHSTSEKLLDRALDEAAVEVTTDLARAVSTGDTVFALFNGTAGDKDVALAIARYGNRGQRIVLIRNNKIVPAAECRALLFSLTRS